MSEPALPTISLPTYSVALPSSNQKFNFRPMKTGERKILLMAMESGDITDISKAIRQIVSACVNQLDVDNIPVFDLEFVFLQLIINSIRNTLDLIVKIPKREDQCPECGKERRMHVDLNNAKVLGIRTAKKDFELDAGSGVKLKLRYPTEQVLSQLDAQNKNEIERMTDLISIHIDSVSDDKGTYPFARYDYKARIEFLDSLPPTVTDQLEEFVKAVPRLTLDFKIQCPACKFEVAHRLTGLDNFFV